MKMTVLNSLQNVAVARPPLMMFIISLVAMLVTVLSLVFYIRLNDEIPNIHVNENWRSFINKLKDEQFCLIPSNSTNSAIAARNFSNYSHSYENVTLNMKINVSTNLRQLFPARHLIDHSLTFAGSFELAGWRPSCGSSSDGFNSTLLMSLTLPTSTSNSPLLSCLTIHSHLGLFPRGKSSTHSQLCPLANVSSVLAGKLVGFNTSNTENHETILVAGPCIQEESVRFSFDANVFEPDSYLSENERLQIAVRLLHGLYLLLTLILILIIFGAYQGKNIPITKHHLLLDKEPLSS